MASETIFNLNGQHIPTLPLKLFWIESNKTFWSCLLCIYLLLSDLIKQHLQISSLREALIVREALSVRPSLDPPRSSWKRENAHLWYCSCYCVCLSVWVCGSRGWGEAGGWMPLPTRPQRYWDHASLVIKQLAMILFSYHLSFNQSTLFCCSINASCMSLGSHSHLLCHCISRVSYRRLLASFSSFASRTSIALVDQVTRNLTFLNPWIETINWKGLTAII